MEHKHVAESVHFNLKELFEICSSVIYESEEECDREVLGEFYDKNGIDHLYDIDDVEY